ncbi:MAG: cysteine--1-D-myo-inosityl 2-amino-2-deoxy-alpha-D-glucopyranoside ligase [Actinobacteria bacterium]|uniref:L-cysteine:1D-myo-inositol 2-amino-2-deoxy-alpha-D-glucopyranoside ligase n=1 Tax=freshwater metagenome TaxID=449393 RepID=A0A6J6HW06_9ZZZZ|nr:cysteine--1-D-myo-inosityl 2-amino-2-deoxy-alpha-D-glucopyranoside ligase [Actinomycetota bacterium]MTA20761.1 cysteine--1-D-myo-inosityl 2-amino-2-deoxy-alpha-D-glucopyranoside ligase [Actinomycetota bacterium]
MESWAGLDLPPLSKSFEIPDLKLFDTASQTIKPLAKKNDYKIYVCGITPYDATHLGHAATYLTFDLINRYLRLSGATVNFVQNITDIDDPLLERAERDGTNWQDLARSQINLFRGDMVNLHVIPPDHYIGVVEAMALIIESIEALVATGNTYMVESDLYFEVHSDSKFGSRSHLNQDEMLEIFSQRGGDPKRAGKRNPLDALLWRGERPGEPSWQSPFGAGRPGWHIECSAIALTYLSRKSADGESENESIDIQGGGSDLVFPHHEMSASQCALITKKEFASHYVHAGMIGLNGEKMSKSLGNLVFVSTLINQGVEPAAIRWALFSSHFTKDRMWNQELLDDSIDWINRLRTALSRVDVAPTTPAITGIIRELSENLNTAAALHLIKEWIEQSENGEPSGLESRGEAGEFSRALDTILGIAL